MTVESGRRERKKAATRQKIADTALRLFMERGYDAVGIRDVAAEADVAVTTLFSHFASKEALVFEQDTDFEQRLTQAVTGRAPHEPLLPAAPRDPRPGAPLHRRRQRPGLGHGRRVPALREYEESMRLRHAETLATAMSADPDLARTTTACRTIARFVIDAYALAREAPDPQAAVDEIFEMIEAAWRVTSP